MSNLNSDQILSSVYDDHDSALRVDISAIETSGAPQAYGVDATGQDAYATVLTVSGAKNHLFVQNTGTHPTILSLNSGTTDHLFIAGNTAAMFDNIAIADAATIQAKNGTAGSNYTGLYLSIW